MAAIAPVLGAIQRVFLCGVYRTRRTSSRFHAPTHFGEVSIGGCTIWKKTQITMRRLPTTKLIRIREERSAYKTSGLGVLPMKKAGSLSTHGACWVIV